MSAIRPLATITILIVVGIVLAMKIKEGPVALKDDPADESGWADAPAFEPTPPDSISEDPVAAPQIDVQAGPPSVPELPGLDRPSPSPNTSGLVGDVPIPEYIPEAHYDDEPADAEDSSLAESGADDEFQPWPAPSQSAQLPAAPTQGGQLQEAQPEGITAIPPNELGGSGVMGAGYNEEAAPPQPGLPQDPPSQALAQQDAQPAEQANPAASSASTQIASEFATAREQIYLALERDELSRAHLLLSQWYGEDSLTDAEQQEVEHLLSQLAGTVVYSTQHRLTPPHTVQQGETLQSIAQQHNVPWQLLGRINGVARPDEVRPGQVLKVVDGPFNAILDLSKEELALILDGRFAGKFPVHVSGLAAGEGEWSVAQKTQQPLAPPSPMPGSVESAGPMSRVIVLKNNAGGALQSVVLTGSTSDEAATAGHGGRISVASQDIEHLYDILSVGSDVVVRK